MSMDKHTNIHKIYSFMQEIPSFLKLNRCIYIFRERSDTAEGLPISRQKQLYTADIIKTTKNN